MKRRVLAAVAAVLVAAVGALVMINYVLHADARAMAGQTPVPVLVIVEPVPAGTPADQLGDAVALRQIPRASVADGALTNLSSVADAETASALVIGEQLLPARFSTPGREGAATVDVPSGLQLVAFQLEPQRVLAGSLVAGQRIGVYASFTDPDQTHQVLRQVLVTAVQGGIVASDDGSSDGSSGDQGGDGSAAAAQVMVTVAVTAAQAEDLVFALDHGTVWLSGQNDKTSDADTRIVDRKEIYR